MLTFLKFAFYLLSDEVNKWGELFYWLSEIVLKFCIRKISYHYAVRRMEFIVERVW